MNYYNYDTLKYLVDTGKSDVNAKDNDGKTALHYATRLGYTDTLKYLVDTGKI